MTPERLEEIRESIAPGRGEFWWYESCRDLLIAYDEALAEVERLGCLIDECDARRYDLMAEVERLRLALETAEMRLAQVLGPEPRDPASSGGEGR